LYCTAVQYGYRSHWYDSGIRGFAAGLGFRSYRIRTVEKKKSLYCSIGGDDGNKFVSPLPAGYDKYLSMLQPATAAVGCWAGWLCVSCLQWDFWICDIRFWQLHHAPHCRLRDNTLNSRIVIFELIIFFSRLHHMYNVFDPICYFLF